MSNLSGIGFETRAAAEPALKHKPVALVQLIATLALAVSTLIAVTVVSIGIARADRAGPAPFATPAVIAAGLGLPAS